MMFAQMEGIEDAIGQMSDGFIDDALRAILSYLPDVDFSPGDYIDLPTAILLMAIMATFMVIVVITMPYIRQYQMKSRLKAVAKRREELKALQLAKRQESSKKSGVSESQLGLMKKVVEMVNLQELLEARELKLKLAGAGYRGASAAIIFTFLRVLTPLVFAGVAAFLLFVAKTFDVDHTTKIIITVVSFPIGFYFPHLILTSQLQARQKEFISNFPDSLDLLVICVEAGLSMEGAFNRVTEEMASTAAVVSMEFGMTSAELAYLGDRQQALVNFHSRMAVDSVKSLSTSLIQSEKYGTPLATALRVIS
ncbi:MAG: type II secretion system F family protein [Alphaproteobacteria bacterium]